LRLLAIVSDIPTTHLNETRSPSCELAPVCIIERGADTNMLCSPCADPISNLIDEFLATGMPRSPLLTNPRAANDNPPRH
jgi:hypothetical protein